MARTIEYIVDVKTGDSLNTLGRLEDELEQINAELKDVDLNSQAFDDLSRRAQDVTQQIDKANLRLEGFTDDRKLQAFRGSLDIVAGGFTAVEGAIAAAGIENEEFEKVMTRLFSTLAIVQGIREMSEGFLDVREAIKASTVAQRAFNLVSKANPILLVAGVLATAVAGWYAYNAAVEDAEDKQRDFNEEARETYNLLKTGGKINLFIDPRDEETMVDLIEKATKRIAELDEEIADTELRRGRRYKSRLKALREERRIQQQSLDDYKEAVQQEFDGQEAAKKRIAELTEELILLKDREAFQEYLGESEIEILKTKIAILDTERKIYTNRQLLNKEYNPFSPEERIKEEDYNRARILLLDELNAREMAFVESRNQQEVSILKSIDLKKLETKIEVDSNEQIRESLRQLQLKKAQAALQDELTTEARKQQILTLVSITGTAFGNLSQLYAQGSAEQKAFALAAIAIETGVGFVNGLRIAQEQAKAGGPLTAYAFPIFYASQIAAVLGAAAQAKQILSTGVQTSGTIGSTGTFGPQVATPTFGEVFGDDANAAAPTATPTLPPVRAYVLQGDITNNTQAEKRLRTKRTFNR